MQNICTDKTAVTLVFMLKGEYSGGRSALFDEAADADRARRVIRDRSVLLKPVAIMPKT